MLPGPTPRRGGGTYVLPDAGIVSGLTDIEKACCTHEWGKLGFTFGKARYLRMGAEQSAGAPSRQSGSIATGCCYRRTML